MKWMFGAIALAALTASAAEENTDQLRSDLEKLTQRLEELEKKQPAEATSSWADKITIKGDLRYRYENINDEIGSEDENRQRIRARLGAYAEVNDMTTAGLRIATRQDANSGNETIGNEFEDKEVFLDLAYMTITPEDGKFGSVTLGKMKYPYKVVTDLIWDSDVNPEGIAYTYSTKLNDTAVFGSAGYFKVEEDAGPQDLDLASFQLGATQPLCEKSTLTAGGSLFSYDNAVDYAFPADYQIAQIFGEVGLKDVLPIPLKIYGDYVNNLEESDENQGFCLGIKFGDAKKGKWEAKAGYRDLDANAAPAPFADSDFAAGGTDVKGFRIKGAYNIAKHLQLGATYIAGEQKSADNRVDTVHLDLIASF